MLSKNEFFCILIFHILASHGLYAQIEDIPWIPLNVPQLTENELLWLNTISKSASAGEYEQVVDFLEQHIHNNLISSADHSAVAILKRTALYPHLVAGRRDNGPSIVHRQQAIHLLGELGGDYSLEAADSILSVETESALLSSLFFVYKELAPPFTSLRSSYFAKHLQRANHVANSDGLILSIMTAVQAMHERSWSMTDGELFTEILAVSDSAKSASNRQRALELARLIVGAGGENRP